MDEEEVALPFFGGDDIFDWGSRNVFAPRNMTKEEKEEKNKGEKWKAIEDHSYYKGSTSSEVAPPDEPLNIVLIHDASIYRVDGSNSVEPMASLKKFKDGVVLGSFNGLVALYRHPGEFCLLNPSTCKKKLVKVNIGEWSKTLLWCPETHLFGLCHDSDSDEYKAVLFNSEDSCFNVVSFKHKERSVRKTQRGLPHFIDIPSGPIGTVVKGVPYWICSVPSRCLIYYFDSKTEEFLMGPYPPNQNRICRLGTLDGKLIASHACPRAGTKFWALDDPRSCSWTLLFVFPEMLRSFSSLSWMTSQAELLVCEGDSELFVLNVRDKSMQLLSKSFHRWMNERKKHCMSFIYYIVPYTPSLIDPSM